MINPNKLHSGKGTVTKLSRDIHGALNLEVTMANGHTLNEFGFIYHKTLKQGDTVTFQAQFSIMNDKYAIKSIRKARG